MVTFKQVLKEEVGTSMCTSFLGWMHTHVDKIAQMYIHMYVRKYIRHMYVRKYKDTNANTHTHTHCAT